MNNEERRRLLQAAIVYVKLKEYQHVSKDELDDAIRAIQSTDTAAEWINRMTKFLMRPGNRRAAQRPQTVKKETP